MPEKADVGRRQALLIGTSHYQDPTLPQLLGPVRDVAAMAEVLGSPDIGEFEITEVTDDGHVTVREAIEDFCADQGRDDFMLIYLSCHGLLDTEDQLFYAAADTTLKRIASTGIDADWLNDRLDGCAARRQVLILDCCHSGGFVGRSKGPGEDLKLERRFTPKARSRVVLTASRKTERSFENRRMPAGVIRSVYTRTLVWGLRTGDADRDGDGWITHSDLHDYLHERVHSEVSHQTPQMWAYAIERRFIIAKSVRGSFRTAAPQSSVGPHPVEDPNPASEVPKPRRRKHIRRRYTTIAVCVLVALAALAASAVAVVLNGSGTPAASVRWTYMTTASIDSPPAVADDSVYIGSDNGYLYALDADTGKLRWKFKTEGPIESRPAVADGTVYIGSDDGNLYALDADTGSPRWSDYTGIVTSSGPAVAGGSVYVGTHQGKKGRLYALEAATGIILWTYTTAGPIDSSPAVANGAVYVGSDDHDVYALTAGSGHVLWRHQTAGPVESSPAVAYGLVYAGSDDGTVYALSAQTGDTQWKFPTGADVFPGPVAAAGILYIGSDNSTVYALNAKTGRLLWTHATEGSMDSSPTVTSATIYVGSDSGTVYALDDETGILRWTGTAGNIGLYGPAVSNGIIYFGSKDGQVYAMSSG
jgi:outer membrane protein assembly factor BamB